MYILPERWQIWTTQHGFKSTKTNLTLPYAANLTPKRVKYPCFVARGNELHMWAAPHLGEQYL